MKKIVIEVLYRLLWAAKAYSHIGLYFVISIIGAEAVKRAIHAYVPPILNWALIAIVFVLLEVVSHKIKRLKKEKKANSESDTPWEF